VAPIGGEDEAAVEVSMKAQAALADIRRIKAMEKRPVKAVIERAVLPGALSGLGPAARDFQAAAHIRDLRFAEVDGPELVFAEEGTVKAGEPGA
jgi:hypothetical protein